MSALLAGTIVKCPGCGRCLFKLRTDLKIEDTLDPRNFAPLGEVEAPAKDEPMRCQFCDTPYARKNEAGEIELHTEYGWSDELPPAPKQDQALTDAMNDGALEG